MNYNIIYKNNNAYEILNEVRIYNFLNKDNSINQKVLGLYVNQIGGDHVLQRDNTFLICKTIEEINSDI
tara:strand:- start:844 stop:1050 length:207 start_codon:yes stop_codon:yes gene_type:complete